MEHSIEYICDHLIDHEYVAMRRQSNFLEAFESYKRLNILLGYFSQLRDYSAEHSNLLENVLFQRREISIRYKDLLISEYSHIFKTLLVSPVKTEWYDQGINKFKKVKNYSTYYYRRALYIEMENSTIDTEQVKKIIETIVSLDKYYDIYDETINFFMLTNDRFERLMKTHFIDYIFL